MKLFIPREILSRAESKCVKHPSRYGFHPRDLVEPLEKFINHKLEALNSTLYDTYQNHRGTNERTLRYAWSRQGKKEDGADLNLRNLLCYFGYGEDWKQTLASLKKDERDIISETRAKKAAYAKTNDKDDALKSHTVHTELSEIEGFVNRVYVELTTRKAALPFDEKHDLVELVYDSWYRLFCTLRDELKSVPVLKLQKAGVDLGAVDATKEILNDVLRPHLTEHQARYRAWLQGAKVDPAYKKLSPQALQKEYPKYKALMASLKQVNEKLGSYASELSNTE